MSQWYLVKLELGPTLEYPNGSPGQAFLLRLPLAADGSVDEAMHAAAPREVFVRRFWQNEPDISGTVLPSASGWIFAFPNGTTDLRYYLDDVQIRPGAQTVLTDSHGARQPFRVVSVRQE